MALLSASAVIRGRGRVTTASQKVKIAFALTNLRSVKGHLKIRQDDPQFDEALEELIEESRDMIENEIHMKLAKRSYVNNPDEVETDGSGRDIIWLRQMPIVSVEKVNLGFGSGDLDPTEFKIYNAAGYIRIAERLSISLQPDRVRREVPFGVQNVRVDYTAGFDPIPTNLRRASNMLIAHLWFLSPASGSTRLGLKSRSGRDNSENFIDDVDIPPRVMKIIDNYRRLGFVSHRDTASSVS